ncbi:MAG: putative hydroxymethylpyrimidine transporter CytX, partial [Suipraeoptans sp.]
MDQTKTSTFSNGLIWFGAAVSIAEILTGTLIAPLGFGKGIAAILIGHAIGCLLLFFAGLIGAKTGKSGMETVKMAFGKKGSLLFSILNVLQLAGWTAVMIASGASAAGGIISSIIYTIWCMLIGALILLWIFIGIKNLSKINTVSMILLFSLSIVLMFVIFNRSTSGASALAEGNMRFGAAIELSIAMPLSWLPLISDYTRFAKKPFAATMTSSVIYFAASSWMYVIGLGAAIITGATDVGGILLRAGLGIAALIIIIFSTVTTTFLDVYSAGVSSESISKRFKEKPVAI